jgi:hypothetical protein
MQYPFDKPMPPDDFRQLPLPKHYPIVAGALVGLLLRLVFWGRAGSRWSAMAGAFIFCVPFFVGMLTVYLAERQRGRSVAYYLFAPAYATGLFVLGTLLIMIEGLICGIVIVPMFAVLGGIGGLLMGAICRLTNWPRPPLYCAAALPIVLGFLGPLVPAPPKIGEIQRSVVIAAPATAVWATVNGIADIRGEEMASALAMWIGVPAPLSGTTRDTEGGRIRESRWAKNVHFEEVIDAWQPQHYVRWTYRFAPDSFPRAAFDDHVEIGGHYFTVLDTDYTLEAVEGSNATRLTTHSHYRVSTEFNFYANWVAQLVLGNLSDAGLQLYKRRSEQAAAMPTAL